MQITSRIGLRGKLSIIIILILAALSLALNYCAASNLHDAINHVYLCRAAQLATFYEANFINTDTKDGLHNNGLQREIENIANKDEEIAQISIFTPTTDGVVVLASSSHELIGRTAGESDAVPIFTDHTNIIESGDNDAGAGGSVFADMQGGNNDTIELVAPIHDSDGTAIASLGILLDTRFQDELIRSQQLNFAILSNLGLLALLIIMYLSINRLFLSPVKELTGSTALVVENGWRRPDAADRNDEVGDLARAFSNMANSLGSREEEVKLLLGASVAVSSELHVDKILQILCEKISCSKTITYCRIALLNEASDAMEVHAESTTSAINGWEESINLEIPLDKARYHREVIRTRNPRIIRNHGERDHDEDADEWEWALTPDTKSALLLPLVSKGEVLGVVTLGEMRTWERSPITAKKIDFYQILMSQAAVAIENAQLYEKTEWQVRELSVMHKISQAFTSTLDYQEVVSIVAQRVGSFIGAQFVSVLLPDQGDQFLNIVASHNLSAEYVWTINKKSRIKTGAGPLGKAFSEQKPFVVTDVASDADYLPWRNLASVQGYSSLVALPLKAKDIAIGVICMYFTEPKKLKKNEIDLLATAANEAAIAIENSKIYENLQDAFIGTIRSLAETIDAKDAYTRGHSEKVSLYAEATARGLGLDGDDIQTIRYAGYLHDVGKIGIPDAILTKPGKLTVEEFSVIKKHPVLSDRILRPVDFPYPVQPLIRHHHERYDGKGYPDTLSGEEIPLGARILAVADSYEAMTSDRPYRKALSVEKALEELQRNSGTQFDIRVVEEFVKIVSSEKPLHSRLRIGA